MAEVVLEHLTKNYPNGIQAVRDLSLCVADGELLVLVGPSGCGKTTTLRLLAGLEEPSAGRLTIGGQVVNSLPPRARDVAMVFQRPALYPHLSVRQNLAFGLHLRRGIRGWPRLLSRLFPGRRLEGRQQEQELAERVTETAQLVGLEDVLDRLPGQLSGGQQQRAALGRAIVRRPALFLLDEPLSQLDSRLRAELRQELHLLQRRLRATMIYVTHDQAEAMTLGDRVAVMDRGVLQQVDRPLAVYERPRNCFVAGFVGWPSMNFLDGQLAAVDGRPSFVTATWALPVPPRTVRAWAPYTGRPLILGIRPEDIRLAGPGWAGARLSLEVALIEPLGASSVLTLQRDSWRLTAQVTDREAVEKKQTVEVYFDMERAHLFDRATGLTLADSRPAG